VRPGEGEPAAGLREVAVQPVHRAVLRAEGREGGGRIGAGEEQQRCSVLGLADPLMAPCVCFLCSISAAACCCQQRVVLRRRRARRRARGRTAHGWIG
jgi:hypothetical protein